VEEIGEVEAREALKKEEQGLSVSLKWSAGMGSF
jgi:hypothetical protein